MRLDEKEQKELIAELKKQMPDYDFQIIDTLGRNDRVKQAIYANVPGLSKSSNGNIVPLFYPSQYKGMDFSEMAQKIKEHLDILWDSKRLESELKWINERVLSKDYVLNHVKLKLCSKDKNISYLQENPHIQAADLAATYYIPMKETPHEFIAGHISNNLMEKLGLDESELKEAALKNVWADMDVWYLTDAIEERAHEMGIAGYKRPVQGEVLEDLKNGRLSDMVMLSTNSTQYGASVILCEEFKNLCKQDLVILPSSTHEVLLLPAEGADLKYLQSVVEEVNRSTVEEEDILSDNVYLFDAKNQKIHLACDKYGLVPICSDTEITIGIGKPKSR